MTLQITDPYKMTESQEQASFFSWLLAFKVRENPEVHPLFFAVPNGAVLAGDAKRRAVQMNKLKSTGLTPGVADTLLLSGHGGYLGLALEFKTPDRQGTKDGGLSEQQAEFLRAARAEGYLAEVAYGADHAEQIVNNYLALPKTQDMVYRALKNLEAGHVEAAKLLLKELVLAW